MSNKRRVCNLYKKTLYGHRYLRLRPLDDKKGRISRTHGEKVTVGSCFANPVIKTFSMVMRK